MRSCSRVAGLVMLAGFFAYSVFAQDVINLTGTVKDSASQAGIQGAIVKLKVAKLSATTNASGAYTLAGTAVRFPGSYQNQLIGTPHFKQNSIFFGVAKNGDQVRIDIYNLLGRNVASYMDAQLGRGNYQVNLFGPALAGQLYFVKLRIGGQATMLKIPFMGNQRAVSGQMIRKISGSDLDNGLAKSAAVDDTLIVAASGYKVTRKAIDSYTGTNDFTLAWYGHGGTIMFDMGSYSGTQFAAAVIVNDSDLTAATIPVKVRSNGDSVGFTLLLQKDAAVAGQYIDSIHFSINQTDTAKKIIMVKQAQEALGDSIYAIYADASPAAVETTIVQWSGNSGQVGPGASMYSGLTTKIYVNLSDPDLEDTIAPVTITAPADTTGIILWLKPVPFSWGSYSGILLVSTEGSSQADGVIKVTGKDILAGENVTIIYYDKTPMQKQVGGICTWRPVIGSLVLDSAETGYHGTVSKMTVTLYEDDIAADTAVVLVKSKKDPTGISRKLPHLGSGTDRVFQGEVGFSTTASNAGTGVIAVQAGDTVSVNYVDTTPDTTVTAVAPWAP